MSERITQALNSYIQQEQYLLDQLTQFYSQRGNVRTEIGKEVITQLAKGYFGRTGGKLARYGVNQAEKERLRSLEAEIDARHQSIVQNVKAFLATVSEYNQGNKQPNSHKLIGQIETAQRGVKVVTRVARAFYHSITLSSHHTDPSQVK